MRGIRRRVKRLTPPQFLAAGFIWIIVIGTLLLYLPFTAKESVSFVDALFTATSAATVTGLVTVDVGEVFNRMGHLVLMVLIQLGGLGLMSFAVLIVLALGKKIGLRERMLVKESFNQPTTGGMIRLAKMLLFFSFSIEGIAALLLAWRWVPEYGWGDGLFMSAFHSVSAFNNAGIGLRSDSLMAYAADPLINLTITALFITGGIGFTVIYDLLHTRKFRLLSLHSKIMLLGTLVLNIAMMFFIFVLEYNNPETLGQLEMAGRLWASYFQAVTPRTAGFNTLDIGSMEPASLLLIMVLMFIGAGSASTGSGIKLTTFVVILLAVAAYLKGSRETVAFERTIPDQVVMRALAIVVMSLILVTFSIFLLAVTEELPFFALMFEAFSAFGTVGLSMGITAELSLPGKIIIMFLMIVGRIGPVTLAFSLAKTEVHSIRYPKGDVFTG
ncbi:TrkH family potassium uptake protein [Alkalicoccus daliensis]|uniref:Trk system potassium uptake protein TrkH n=1 Tax=Alkalicoccus daliensis TaxID=745820 RepID=A0A1H0EWW2_9BACI|nr:TrkH family potassium uptake protein [Alkalicoccus daliensis]SDN86927.1 trk system potassium uptake protein TrkH [Alkalicoccus daliensis]